MGASNVLILHKSNLKKKTIINEISARIAYQRGKHLYLFTQPGFWGEQGDTYLLSQPSGGGRRDTCALTALLSSESGV